MWHLCSLFPRNIWDSQIGLFPKVSVSQSRYVYSVIENQYSQFIHWSLVTHLYVNKVRQSVCRYWILAYPSPSQYMGWGLLSKFPPFRYFRFFKHCQNTRYLLNITFIFDRCRRSWAAVTPVKYECDSKNLTGNFARSKILHTQKLMKGALVTPDTGSMLAH